MRVFLCESGILSETAGPRCAGPASASVAAPANQPMRQLLLDLIPETPPRLDNFVAGGNREALAGLAGWLRADSGECSLLFWGETGSGKTHLLLASGAAYADAAENPDLAGLAELATDFPCHAVDNVESLSPAGQIALFNLFNRLRAAGGRLLTAARQAPRHLALREDLRTRLGSGLVYRLHALADAEQIDALTAQAEARGMALAPEAIAYIQARARRDMRSLSALLAGLDRYSLERRRPITLPLLREVLSSENDYR